MDILPDIGNKLEYFLGNATGSEHNIERSTEMLRQLNSIGLFDTPETRQYLRDQRASILSDDTNVVAEGARITKETILYGPRGGLKWETIWEGNKLITGTSYGR